MLAAIGAIVGLLFARMPVPPLSLYDQPFYLGIAQDLVHTGRFTDGFMFASPGDDGRRPPGMRFAPLYPALLAAAARLEPGFDRDSACVVTTDGHGPCGTEATLPRTAQALALVAILWLVWWIAASVAGGGAGMAALGLALCTAPVLLRSVMVTMTEIAVLLADLLAIACALRALWSPERSTRWAATCGAMLGIATLLRPSGLELALAIVAGGLGWLVACRPGRRRRLAQALGAGGLALVLVLSPWLLRNARLGHAGLTEGYAGHTLVQRISFDSMTPHEYAMSFVCWLPDGSGLGAAIGGRGACDRFGWEEHADSFYAIGLGRLLARTLAEAGGPQHHLRWLLRHEIAAHPLRHALVTLPLALRGAWIDHWWGVMLLPVCLVWAVRRRRDPQVWLIAGPALFMLLFNAAVAVNQPRYNLLLVLPMAVAGGDAVDALARRLRAARAAGPRRQAEACIGSCIGSGPAGCSRCAAISRERATAT